MSAPSINSIEKLHSTNYQTWKLKIELILTREDTWDIVTGDEPPPSDKGKEKEGSESSKKTDTFAAWQKKDRNARATILLSVNDSELTHVRDCKTSSEIWQKLVEIYEPKGFARKRYLRRQFCLLQMNDGDTMQQHINKLDDIIRQLGGIGVSYPDDEVAMTLLDSLPESYSTLVVVLESMNEVTTEFVKTRLLQEENRRQESSSNENSALLSKKSNKSSKNKKKNPTNKKSGNGTPCPECKIIGHKREDCWFLHPEKRPKPSSKPNEKTDKNAGKSAMLATCMVTNKSEIETAASSPKTEYVPTSNDQNVSPCKPNNDTNEPSKNDRDDRATNVITPSTDAAFLSGNTSRVEIENWYVDSGATQHMTPRRDWFKNYSETAPSNVHLADG
jgi:hypothetical protein